MPPTIDYQLTHERASRGYDGRYCWVQARAGAIPAAVAGTEHPLAVLTMQPLDLTGSDVFYALHSLHSTDMGVTWTAPQEQTNFRRVPYGDDLEITVCDFTPKWHAASGKLLGTGHSVVYRNGHEIPADRDRHTPWAVYDPATHRWSDYQFLAMPDEPMFRNCGAGCTQRVDLEDGTVLLPVYLSVNNTSACCVLHCAFDGRTLTLIEAGDIVSLDLPGTRGLGEPSLTRFNGRFYLTLRNDLSAYVAVSDDGLRFSPPLAWRFDDGAELGSYNTQAHWVTHHEGLFLAYTRRGLRNDHVFRHRAPIVMAQVDPERVRVIRETERKIVPERGARTGNFGVTDVTPDETWLVAAEWMQTTGPNPMDHTVCRRYGADNTVWVARIQWDRPNALA